MTRSTFLKSAALCSLILVSGASSGAVVEYSPLPVGKMLRVPAKSPSHVGGGDHVSGLFVAQAPPPQGNANYRRIQILDSQKQAAEFSARGYVQSTSGGIVESKECVFVADDSVVAGDDWPALARGEISTFAGSGQKPVLGVHIESLDDGAAPGHTASLDVTDAWLDTRTRGLKLIARNTIPLATVAEGPFGIRVLAARSDDSVHFVVLPPPIDAKDAAIFGSQSDRGIIESGGEVGVSQCRHSRVSLQALPGTGEHAVVSFQHVERAPREAADPERSDSQVAADLVTLSRTRLVQVHLSASKNATGKEPIVSVSFRVDKPKPFGT